jgi:hypothetical protein
MSCCLTVNEQSSIPWREQVTINEFMLMSSFFQSITPSWIFITVSSLKPVDNSLHVDTILNPSQLILQLLLLNAEYILEKQQIPTLLSLP